LRVSWQWQRERAEEIAALQQTIVALDKSVAEATEQRKNEHQDFKDLMASDSAAKELLHFAKNRLAKFYSPKLYKAPPKEELSSEDRIVENMGGAMLVQVSEHTNAPPPARMPHCLMAVPPQSQPPGKVRPRHAAMQWWSDLPGMSPRLQSRL